MTSRNSKMVRIHNDLSQYLKEIARRNNMSVVNASKDIIRAVKGKKIKEEKIIRELKF